MAGVAGLLLGKPKSQATPVGDVLNFTNPNEDEERLRRNRLAGRAMGWETQGDEAPGPLAPLANMSVYRTLRDLQKGQ